MDNDTIPLNTISDISRALSVKHLSALELMTLHLARINEAKALNAFISLDEETALAEAKQADRLIHNGESTPLTGIPLAHKDVFCVGKTTCGSKMLVHFHAPYEATVVLKLRAAGAVTLGKTNMDEFGMGSTSETSYFGPVKNPWNVAYLAGGSSSGSAAAVSASLVTCATGSDTGGSIRQPAAFCNVSGLKPSYGLVSRYGMVSYASSLEQAGPIAKTVEDLALMLSYIAGQDKNDSTSISYTVPNYIDALTTDIRGIKIGLPIDLLETALDPEISTAVEQAVLFFEKAGAKIIPIKIKTLPYWIPCYYVIACAEASSNLARYDGLRYGYHADMAGESLEAVIKANRTEGFGEEVKKRLLMGTFVLSSSGYDAYYLQALKVRRWIQAELIETFKQVDVLLGPTTPKTAPKSEQSVDPLIHYLSDMFTVSANLAGVPALSIPGGMSVSGLPIGLQLIGGYLQEKTLLQVGHCYQKLTDWHHRKPSFFE